MGGATVPLTPPALDAPPRFEPVFVTEDDLEDLATFFGMTRAECLNRLREYSLREMADAWRQANPRTPDEILDFYRKTELYIWELMQWHASVARTAYWQALAHVATHYPPANGYARVYDFGCGVGTDALFLATRGYDVTLVDVEGPTFRFAQHRFRRRGLTARYVMSLSPVPQPDAIYDISICFDVFEHLPDPLAAARSLITALRPHGLLLQCGSFGDAGDQPCHLHDSIARFHGLRWHIHLAGRGLRTDASFVYRKTGGLVHAAQKARYLLWRVTGLWMNYV
jgi:SAM-dependent methyltransferase